MLAPRPTPKLEDHPSSAVRGCLFNLFRATLHIGGRSSIRNPRTRLAVVTGTHIHGIFSYSFLKSYFYSLYPMGVPLITTHIYISPRHYWCGRRVHLYHFSNLALLLSHARTGIKQRHISLILSSLLLASIGLKLCLSFKNFANIYLTSSVSFVKFTYRLFVFD